jgi:hypothetical protein
MEEMRPLETRMSLSVPSASLAFVKSVSVTGISLDFFVVSSIRLPDGIEEAPVNRSSCDDQFCGKVPCTPSIRQVMPLISASASSWPLVTSTRAFLAHDLAGKRLQFTAGDRSFCGLHFGGDRLGQVRIARRHLDISTRFLAT